MLPKNSKHYIVPTAETLGKDPQLVKDVVEFYYALVRKNLTGLTHPAIQLENLGNFRMKAKELPKLLEKYNTHLAVLTKDTFSQMTLRKELEEKKIRIVNLQTDIESEKERKIIHVTKKKDERSRKNLEIQKRNS